MEEPHDDTRRYVEICIHLPNHLDLNIVGVCLFTTPPISWQRVANAEDMLWIKAVRKIKTKDLGL